MKVIQKYVGSLLCVGICVFIAGKASAQIINGGFETAGATATNAANWFTQFTGTGVAAYGARTNDNPHSGSFDFQLHVASDGAGPVEELLETGMVASASTPYNFSFYSDRLSGSAGDADQYRIQWLNAAGAPIGDTGFLNFSPGNNAYAQTSITVTSIVGTVFATIDYHIAGAAAPSLTATLDFDDVSFAAAVPEPSTFVLAGIGLLGAFIGLRRRK
jgi:PEP-CTERM motif-containing protein